MLWDKQGPFIAGEDFTAVDINVVPLLVNFIVACNHFKDYNFFEDMPNIRTYCEVYMLLPMNDVHTLG